MLKTMKETVDRAKACKCVRFDDKKGFSTKFNKTNFQDELRKEMYYYSVKCVEQVMRGFPPTSVATKAKFEKFRKVSEVLKLRPSPEGFQSLTHLKKREVVEKLVDEFDNELAAAMSRQADDSDNMQVGADSARPFDMTGIDMQVINPGQIQVDEVPAAAPNRDFGNTLSNDASLQNVAWNQWGMVTGPPSRPPVPLENLVFIINDLMHRASRFPGVLPKFEWSEEAFRSFVIQLELLEEAFEDRSNTNSKSHEEELYPSLEGFSAYEAVTSMPSMEESLENEIWGNLSLLKP